MMIKNILKKLNNLEIKTLQVLNNNDEFSSILLNSKLKDIEVMRALQWMQNKKLIELHEKKNQIIQLGENGNKYLKQKLPERVLAEFLKENSTTIKDLDNTGLNKDEINVAIGILKKKAAIEFDHGNIILTSNGKKLVDTTMLEENLLNILVKDKVFDELKDEEKYALENLKKRKGLIEVIDKKIITVTLTPLGKEAKKNLKNLDLIDILTPNMLNYKTWKQKEFRAYDVTTNVPSIYGGKKHFVNQAIKHIKKIWLEMGFVEMEGQLLQTSFWDLDALFVPQDHPARTMQDTFFIKDPKKGKLPKELIQVFQLH